MNITDMIQNSILNLFLKTKRQKYGVFNIFEVLKFNFKSRNYKIFLCLK